MKKITCSFYLIMLSVIGLFAQTTQPIGLQAESGALGSDFATGTDGAITYVYPSTDLEASGNPGNDTKVITYSVTFPEADTYDLYVKLYIGPNSASDDSFFTPRSVGAKTSSDTNDWVNINALHVAGHTLGTDVVTGDNMGTTILEQWKWVNVSQFYNTGTKWSYDIEPSALTVDFQIGSRENGLWIDKLVFGKKGVTYTVDDLEASTTLSINTYNALSTVNVYPNPSNNQFNINTRAEATSFKIYNILGAKVDEGVLNYGLNQYGVHLKPGTYILDLQSKGKRNVTKIVKM
ncbi:T9SS type A sorting domain-containing protein [Algibacter miyuki]|uniref:T9SS type A sorting domain-containing protein n=1 Tax=Algibacter miyuki TaxID=1306933 RepID=A0ABV5H059_9FLAO|nr:T9SS type A sorting domain-containing protein [Algibacter miyuki]MDN3667550.1 T9SS type A sorting domain-containing protein [Algibacter miyuki]